MKIFILITILIVSSCSIKKRKKSNKDVVSANELLYEKNKQVVKQFAQDDDFWPGRYYNSTSAIVNNPKTKITEQQLWQLCKGRTLSHLKTYQGIFTSRVAYLKTPVVFYTDSGFKKEVFISKGMCRELALYKSRGKKTEKIDDNRRLRFKLQQMLIEYIYTDKAFATELSFNSKFKGVKFIVR